MKLFAKGHLIFLCISFICSSLQNTSVQILSLRLCFLLWVESVLQSRPGAGKFINVCYTVGEAGYRPSLLGGIGCIQTVVWPHSRTRGKQGGGRSSCPAICFSTGTRTKWKCQTQLFSSHPRSGLLWKPELERHQHLLK